MSLPPDHRFQTLRNFLIAELVYIAVVNGFFKIFDPPVAGLVAGAGFLILGAVIVWRVTCWNQPWRWASFWGALLYLVGAVLPILISRIATWGVDFHEVRILGMPGPRFHAVSGGLYVALILATVVDLWRVARTKK